MPERRSPLGIIFLTVFVSMIGFGIVIPVLPLYAKSTFNLSPSQLGWLTGIFSLAQLFAAPFIGKISDRVGRKPVLLVSIAGTAIGYFVTGAANAAWMLFLGRIIDGVSGGNISTAQACIADVTSPKDRSKAMGVIGAAFGLGFILGPALGGILGQHFGPSAPFYFAGALSVLNALLAVKYLPETLSEEKRAHPSEKASLGEVFTNKREAFIGLMLAIQLVFTTGFASIHVLFALFCKDRFNWNLRETGLAFAFVGFIAVAVQGGLIRQLLKKPIEKEVTIVGCILLALSLWLLPRTFSVAGFLGVSALLALGNGLATPTITGMSSRHVHGKAQGRVLGLMASAGSLGRFLGPAIAVIPLPLDFSEASRTAEYLQTLNRGYTTAFTWAAALVLLAAVFAFALPIPKENPDENDEENGVVAL